MAARLTRKPIDVATEWGAFSGRASGAGAVVTFTGVTRGEDEEGRPIESLFLDHYPGMTETSLERIAGDASRRHEVLDVEIIHRCGDVPAGETIVFVAAAARHRRAAFLAADEMMDRLKTEAMFWKKERTPGGTRWIEPTAHDRDDAARWSSPCPE